MPLINHAKGEINAKLVVAGPASAGKTTNLKFIYSKLKETFRGTFKSMNLQNDRMLFFDFTPSGQGSVQGYAVRFHIYTMVGEVTHPSSWKMVLKGADGLLFVADSSPDRMTANVESLKTVQAGLAAYGKTLADIPCVMQCNKRDLPQTCDVGEMGRILNPGNVPVVPAVAGKGEGVLESLFALVKLVLKELRSGGLELQGEPDHLQRMADIPVPERPEVPPVSAEEVASEAAPAAATAEGMPDAGEEPVVDVDGEPELLEGGGVRLPVAIRCGGRTKRLSLTVSLKPDPD